MGLRSAPTVYCSRPGLQFGDTNWPRGTADRARLAHGEINWPRGAAARARRAQPSIGENERLVSYRINRVPGGPRGSSLFFALLLDRKSAGGVAALVVKPTRTMSASQPAFTQSIVANRMIFSKRGVPVTCPSASLRLRRS